MGLKASTHEFKEPAAELMREVAHARDGTRSMSPRSLACSASISAMSSRRDKTDGMMECANAVAA